MCMHFCSLFFATQGLDLIIPCTTKNKRIRILSRRVNESTKLERQCGIVVDTSKNSRMKLQDEASMEIELWLGDDDDPGWSEVVLSQS